MCKNIYMYAISWAINRLIKRLVNRLIDWLSDQSISQSINQSIKRPNLSNRWKYHSGILRPGEKTELFHGTKKQLHVDTVYSMRSLNCKKNQIDSWCKEIHEALYIILHKSLRRAWNQTYKIRNTGGVIGDKYGRSCRRKNRGWKSYKSDSMSKVTIALKGAVISQRKKCNCECACFPILIFHSNAMSCQCLHNRHTLSTVKIFTDANAIVCVWCSACICLYGKAEIIWCKYAIMLLLSPFDCNHTRVSLWFEQRIAKTKENHNFLRE